jgi:hypothetical protein
VTKRRTAQGKMIDMDALRAKNEHVRAVGNMRVNARGDIIDAYGKVINDSTKRVNEHYMKAAIATKQQNLIPNRQPQKTASTNPIQTTKMEAIKPDVVQEINEFTRDELDFDQEDLDFVRDDKKSIKSKSSKKD